MPPRGFTNPAPKTDSARSALTSFHCTLCNKSYSRHPEYEAHISSYDHQHKKRLRDLKVLSRDPYAAERARKAERKADKEAGLMVVDGGGDGGLKRTTGDGGSGPTGGSSSGGFKKGGFKSSFTKIGQPAGAASAASGGGATAVKNVLGGDDEDEEEHTADAAPANNGRNSQSKSRGEDADAEVESDTDEEYGADGDGGGYYDPRKPTDCFAGCPGVKHVAVA